RHSASVSRLTRELVSGVCGGSTIPQYWHASSGTCLRAGLGARRRRRNAFAWHVVVKLDDSRFGKFVEEWLGVADRLVVQEALIPVVGLKRRENHSDAAVRLGLTQAVDVGH